MGGRDLLPPRMYTSRRLESGAGAGKNPGTLIWKLVVLTTRPPVLPKRAGLHTLFSDGNH